MVGWPWRPARPPAITKSRASQPSKQQNVNNAPKPPPCSFLLSSLATRSSSLSFLIPIVHARRSSCLGLWVWEGLISVPSFSRAFGPAIQSKPLVSTARPVQQHAARRSAQSGLSVLPMRPFIGAGCPINKLLEGRKSKSSGASCCLPAITVGPCAPFIDSGAPTSTRPQFEAAARPALAFESLALPIWTIRNVVIDRCRSMSTPRADPKRSKNNNARSPTRQRLALARNQKKTHPKTRSGCQCMAIEAADQVYY